MIKIEFSGSGEEVRSEMLRLLGLQGPQAQVEAAKEESSDKTSVQPAKSKGRRQRRARKAETAAAAIWTDKEAETLLKQIKPNAKRILTELANKPEGYRISDLAEALGLQEGAIRGQLSSIGFALRRMNRKPSPIKRDKLDGDLTYKLNPVVAATAQQNQG